MPEDKPTADITINGYSFQLINTLINHNPDHVDALQIRGDAALVENLKALMVRMGVVAVFKVYIKGYRRQ
ncbi:hypothetical protein AABM16_02855 [Moraxella catarrhalis]